MRIPRNMQFPLPAYVKTPEQEAAIQRRIDLHGTMYSRKDFIVREYDKR